MPQIVMQRKNEKTGCPKDAQPLTMPTQENLKIKKYYTNECKNVKKEKFKSNIVGVGVPKGITDLYSHVRSNNSEMLYDPNDYNVNKSKKEQNPIALNNIFNYNWNVKFKRSGMVPRAQKQKKEKCEMNKHTKTIATVRERERATL